MNIQTIKDPAGMIELMNSRQGITRCQVVCTKSGKVSLYALSTNPSMTHIKIAEVNEPEDKLFAAVILTRYAKNDLGVEIENPSIQTARNLGV